ncbi:hypothetical protein N7535_000640 [Penicillium sp. DV-2018c]|nr:hypothetical protein N7535_000640 [Penicillium sp. DV-2018c]
MANGTCFCGNILITTGQPIASGLCHCHDCRKLTGSPYSHSILFKTADLKITGVPKEVSKTADSGNTIKNYFCPDCGTPLFGRKITDGIPDEVTVVRGGIFDDSVLNQWKPGVEIFTEARLEWVAPVEGAGQVCGMLMQG